MFTLTLATLALLALLLPGAFAAWAFQRHREWYGNRARDWSVRLAGYSALLLAAGSWPLYWFLSRYHQDLAGFRPVPRWLALVPVVYLGVPLAVGSAMGFLSRHRMLARLLAPRRHPSAWDHVFGAERPGFVRCRLRTGEWVGGLLTREHWIMHKGRYEFNELPSHVAADGESFSMFISVGMFLDQDTGAPLRDGLGDMLPTGTGVLVDKASVSYIEFVPSRAERE